MSSWDDKVAELIAEWLEKTAELHKHGLKLANNGTSLLKNGEYENLANVIGALDDLVESLHLVTQTYSATMAALNVDSGYDGQVDELPPIVKKNDLSN